MWVEDKFAASCAKCTVDFRYARLALSRESNCEEEQHLFPSPECALTSGGAIIMAMAMAMGVQHVQAATPLSGLWQGFLRRLQLLLPRSASRLWLQDAPAHLPRLLPVRTPPPFPFISLNIKNYLNIIFISLSFH